jgi:hypothetical protein
VKADDYHHIQRSTGVVVALFQSETEEKLTDLKRITLHSSKWLVAAAFVHGGVPISNYTKVFWGFPDFSESLPENDGTVTQLCHEPSISSSFQSLSINNHSQTEAILSELLAQPKNWPQKYFIKIFRQVRTDQEDKWNPSKPVPMVEEQSI